MKKFFTHFSVAVLLMFSATSWAQKTLEAGKVYNFKNVEYGKSMASVGTEKTAIADTDLTDYTQLWYVGEGSVDGTYTLRSLGNGLYLKGNGAGSKWPFVEQPSNLYYQAAGDGFSLTADSGQNPTHQYWMHYGAGNGCIVGWDANAGASQWTVEEVAISAQDLQANWEEVALLNGASGKVAVYQTYLDNLFFDKSCTTPKKLLSSVSDIENDVDYRALPAGLQAMVKKVYLGEWSEKNIISEKLSWSSEHAKRFRVQLYEPYSYGERTNSMLGIYAHSNMNNPTGLVANQRNLLYVMVEGEIKEGARLYLQSLVGDGRIGDIGGVELTEGLNIIPYWSDGNQLFIQYVVNTYENGAKTGHKLSQYKPLKIHIQGGCINGCFDTVGDALNPADTDEDWDAYEVRAHQYNFTVLGKYVMWHMPLLIDDKNTDYYDLSECLGTNATSVKTAMDAWETLESAQRLMEGLLSEQEVNTIPNASRVFEYTGNDSDELYPSDYSQEYNNRSMAYSTKDGYFMFAADWSTHYASNTLDDVILNIATAGDPWGPSHEIGHTYQGPINLPSTSETSNNAIANVSNWFLGRTSSRLGSTQSLLEQYNNNTSFLGTDINSGNVWEKLMMYTKLWFYYHVTGHNKKFYPRLFEMLRRDPIARNKGVALSGNETMLKFYKYACMAAGEDLTDFFEVFGFFVPVDGTLSDDYGDFKTVMTQAEIDAAKAEVAAMAAEKGWKKNTAIIFIDDRIGTVYSHDGQTVLQPRGDGGKEQGVLGSINDFDSNPNNDVAPLSGEYSYTISGNTITMQGATGGVGFIIYDADGNLVSFSNTYSFPLGEKAQAALASGTARVVVTTADIDAKPIEIHDANATQTQAELLEGLLSQVQELLGYEDESGTKVGYYKSSALEALKKAYDAASAVYDAKQLASYGGVYSVLYEEYNAVTTSPVAKTEFVDGRTYYLKNVKSGRYMTVEGDNVMAKTTTVPTAASTASLWQINAGFYESFYSIKNQSTDTYIRQPQKEGDNYNNGQQFVMTSSSQEFIFEEVSTGKFAIKDRGSKKYLNYHEDGSKIATWGGNDAGSQWEIVYLPTNGTMEQRTKLEDLMLQAQLLVDEVSNSEVVYEELPLQVTDPYGQYYLWTNAQDAYEGDISYLIDNETGDTGGKFFHSDYHNSSKPAGYHYLEVYLGADNTNSIFKFAYTNRNNGSNHPDGIAVKVSNTKDDYQNGTIVYEVLSDLPQGQGKSWSSDVFATGEAYKYLHFKITADNTYWHMDEFDIYTPVVSIELFNDYSSIGEGVVKDVINAMMNNTILLSENGLSSEQLKEAYNELLDVYNELLDAKTAVDNSALNAEKERLQALVNSATSLINECKVGDIVSSPAAEVPVVMQATDPSAANYLYCNALYNKSVGNNNGDNCMNTAKLLDDNIETYLHTIPDGQNPDDNLDHYLRVDFGDGAQNGMMKFAYRTRKVSSYKVFPETIIIEGSNDLDEGFEEIKIISSGLPSEANESYESAVFGNGKSYRYIRFMVTDTHADRTTSDNPTYGQHKYFCLAEFDLWIATVDQLKVTLSGNCGGATETMVLDAYRAVQAAQKSLEMATTAEQLQTAYSVLEAAYTTLESAKNIVNTDALQSLYDDALALYGEMADGEGHVNSYYEPSALTNEKLAEAKTALDAAKTVLDSSNSQGEIDAAKTTLQTQYEYLLGIKNSDVTGRDELNALIGDVQSLLGEVADKTTAKTAIALQTTDANADFYIWSNAKASDCDGVGASALIDKNNDGTANTGTFFGTVWQGGAVTNYSHYITVDLGTEIALNELSLDYTTRNSTHSNQRPTSIKVLGCNDKEGEYAEITTLSEGMPVGQNQKWEMTSTVALNSYYRYIRFAPATEMGYFNMSDFNLYAHSAQVVNSNYQPAGITGEQLFAMNAALLAGIDARDNYVTEENYNTALAALRTQYNALLAIKNANVATTIDKSGLNTAIANANTLIAAIENKGEGYYATTNLALDELQEALSAANDVATRFYLTGQQYTDALEALNGCLSATQAVVDADAADRAELEALISATEALVAEVATDVDVEEERLSLQCNDENAPYYIFCNAPEKSTTYPGDNLGVAALLDVDGSGEPVTSTHLHTAYSGNDAYDNLDHYLRVDMGEANLLSFRFAYISRSNTNNAPTEILIEGISDLEGGEWEEITTLTDLPAKAYSSGEITNGKIYRYIRFMVKATVNNDKYNGHPYFAMSHFEMTACKRVALKEGTGIDAVCEAVAAAVVEKQQADYLLGHYATEDDCNNALAELQAAYNALAEKIKEPLKTLIYNTTLLKNSLYEIDVESYTPVEVILQCERDGEEGYLYCNAPETNSQWTDDNKGVAGCIDLTDGNPNLGTFLHTEYGNDQSADRLDHYLRVDLGEGGAAYVEFGYVGRSGHLEKSPETVVVAATNDLNGEWTTIETLNMAQPNATTETKTGAVGNGDAYRYWRFMVTDTHFNGQDGNGHKYFALSDFNVYKCTDVVLSSQLKDEYEQKIHIYTTTEFVTDVEAAITAATAVYNNTNATMEDCNNAIAALQPVYDELARAIELYWCPVKLTTDVANPALYTIDAVRRGNNKAWQYNAQNNNITIVDKAAENLYHLWYFMLGTEQTVKIIPVMTPQYELGATEFGDGAGKVSAVAENSVNWSFAFVNNYWNFKPAGVNTYLSHYGGRDNALGFYGSADEGSSVRFTAVEVNDYAKARLAKLAEDKEEVSAGTAVGTYTEASAGGYNAALESANELLANANSTPQEYVDAFTNLFNASGALVINMPQSDKFYVLRCNHESRYIYVNAENKLQWAASSYDKAQSRAVWQFEEIDASNGTCKLKSLHTQSYLSGLSGGQWAFGETGKVVTLAKSPSVDGAVIFKIEGNGNNGLHAHGNNNTVISHTNEAGANHYFLEVVEDVTTIKHTVTMNATFSSVMLGYNATVPEGVEAYNAVGVDEDGVNVSLKKIAGEGEVIPANTPVVLYRTTNEEPDKTFNYTETGADKPDETVLGGSLYLKYVKCDDKKDYYKLMIKGGEAKMYWMYKEFNAAGVSQGQTNEGGHIKCSANKIYMVLPPSQAAASFGMRFIDGGATGLNGTLGENGEPETIYDLTGRKVVDTAVQGVYIINGKKVLVK